MQPPVASPLVIQEIEDLELAFSRLPRTRRRVQLALAELNVEENSLWQDRINRYADSCGCDVGAAATCLAVLTYSMMIGFHSEVLKTRPLLVIGAAFAVAGFAAGLGKGIGLVYARFRLRLIVRSLLLRVSHTTPVAPFPIHRVGKFDPLVR